MPSIGELLGTDLLAAAGSAAAPPLEALGTPEPDLPDDAPSGAIAAGAPEILASEGGSAEGVLPTDGRPSRARLPVAVEAHGIGRQARRYAPDDPGQFAFELKYPRDGGTALWRVTADNDTVVIVPTDVPGGESDAGRETALQHAHKLPGPMAQDLLIVVGEDANARTRGRRWNLRDNAERTFEWSMTELLARIGKSDGGKYYKSLRETLLRLARLRIEASGGAGREGKRWTKRTIVTGLIDRLEIVEEPGETRVKLTISEDLAQQFAEDFRLLETTRYWLVDSGPARRLYRLLDWACYAHDHRGTGQVRVPVHFLRDRIPIDEQKTAQIVRKLDVMHEELVRVGFLAAMPTYGDTLADDLRRFPTYPGKRAKLVSAVYQIVSEPALGAGSGTGGREVMREVTGDGRSAGAVTAVTNGSAVSGATGSGMAADKAALLAQLGIGPSKASGRSELHERVLAVQQLCGDRGNVGLYTALCKALPEEAYDRIVATVRADRPEVPRAAFVRMAKDELRRYGIEVPSAARDMRLMADMLRNPS